MNEHDSEFDPADCTEKCPPGEHVHIQHEGHMDAGIPFNPAGLLSRLFEIPERPTNSFLTGDMDVTLLRVAALDHFAQLFVNQMDGEDERTSGALYLAVAQASADDDFPRMMRAMEALFTFQAARQGVPRNPAEAMAEAMGIAAEMAYIIETVRTRREERKAEAVAKG